jgi:hypothetical protein
MRFIFLFLIISNVSAKTLSKKYCKQLSIKSKTSGRVIFVRGKVTALIPGKNKKGSHNLCNIFTGMRIPNGTSIVTKNKSVVKIKLIDSSQIMIGPNSKSLINRVSKNPKKGTLISVLKGHFRTKVIKNSKKTKKFYIKTQQVALGVRGTEFLVTKGPNATSVVTFEGSVSIVKTPKSKISNKSLIKKINKSNVLIKEGEASSINKKKFYKPRKISKNQFKLLKSDRELLQTESASVEKNETVVNLMSGNIYKNDFKGKLNKNGHVSPVLNYSIILSSGVTNSSFLANSGSSYKYSSSSHFFKLEGIINKGYRNYHLSLEMLNQDWVEKGCDTCSGASGSFNNKVKDIQDITVGYSYNIHKNFDLGTFISLSDRPIQSVGNSVSLNKGSVNRFLIHTSIHTNKKNNHYLAFPVFLGISEVNGASGDFIKVVPTYGYNFSHKYSLRLTSEFINESTTDNTSYEYTDNKYSLSFGINF